MGTFMASGRQETQGEKKNRGQDGKSEKEKSMKQECLSKAFAEHFLHF